MAFGVGRGISTPLLVVNFAMYLVTAVLAGWALNKNIDSSAGAGGYVGNAATFYFLPLVLIASVVGLASTLAGIHHLRVWRTDSLAAAASASLVAWSLTLLAFGYKYLLSNFRGGVLYSFGGRHTGNTFASPICSTAKIWFWSLTLLAFGVSCKEMHIGGPRSRKLKVVEAFTIILAAFELLYLLSLHVGIFGGDYGPACTTTPGVSAATTGHVGLQGEKHHSAAAAAAV